MLKLIFSRRFSYEKVTVHQECELVLGEKGSASPWSGLCAIPVSVVTVTGKSTDNLRALKCLCVRSFGCRRVFFVNVKGPLAVLLQPEILQQRRGNATAAVRRKQERDTTKFSSGLLERTDPRLFSGIGENLSSSPVRFFFYQCHP